MKEISKTLMSELLTSQRVYEKSLSEKFLRKNSYDEESKSWYYEGNRNDYDLYLTIKNTKRLAFSYGRVDMDNLEIIDIKKDNSNAKIIITCRDDIIPELEFQFIFEIEKKQ